MKKEGLKNHLLIYSDLFSSSYSLKSYYIRFTGQFTHSVTINEWIDLGHCHYLGHHTTQPPRVDEIKVTHLEGRLIVMENHTRFMKKFDSLENNINKDKNNYLD